MADKEIEDKDGLRLQVYMARCGAGSRRACEKYIADGQVRVNGQVVTEMGFKVSPGDIVEYRGRKLYPDKKKILVCTEVAMSLGLENVTTRWCRAEEEKEKFDFVVSRAVMPLADLVKICRKNMAKEQHHALPNGLICLKGGELEHETYPMKKCVDIMPLSDYFAEEYFKTKKVVYLPL